MTADKKAKWTHVATSIGLALGGLAAGGGSVIAFNSAGAAHQERPQPAIEACDPALRERIAFLEANQANTSWRIDKIDQNVEKILDRIEKLGGR